MSGIAAERPADAEQSELAEGVHVVVKPAPRDVRERERARAASGCPKKLFQAPHLCEVLRAG